MHFLKVNFTEFVEKTDNVLYQHFIIRIKDFTKMLHFPPERISHCLSWATQGKTTTEQQILNSIAVHCI